MTKQTPIFEHTTCPRCGGCGEYSYNQMHGTRCYGCNGTGYKLTKRGHAALQYLRALRSVPASTLKVGDLVWFDLFDVKCCERIIEIKPSDCMPGQLDITARRTKTGELIMLGVLPTSMMQRGFTAEEKQQQIEQALAYQDTLTKQGAPRKKVA